MGEQSSNKAIDRFWTEKNVDFIKKLNLSGTSFVHSAGENEQQGNDASDEGDPYEAHVRHIFPKHSIISFMEPPGLGAFVFLIDPAEGQLGL